MGVGFEVISIQRPWEQDHSVRSRGTPISSRCNYGLVSPDTENILWVVLDARIHLSRKPCVLWTNLEGFWPKRSSSVALRSLRWTSGGNSDKLLNSVKYIAALILQALHHCSVDNTNQCSRFCRFAKGEVVKGNSHDEATCLNIAPSEPSWCRPHRIQIALRAQEIAQKLPSSAVESAITRTP